MISGLNIGLALALTGAIAAIVLGRNLTRSVVAGYVSIAGLGFALLVAGSGFLGFVVVILAVLALATIQLFGWMLVDIDRDHLPPSDRPTWIARSLALLLFGGGLVLLVALAQIGGELTVLGSRLSSLEPSEIGSFLFGSMRDATILLGFTIAAALLAVLLLLRDDAGGDGR